MKDLESTKIIFSKLRSLVEDADYTVSVANECESLVDDKSISYVCDLRAAILSTTKL